MLQCLVYCCRIQPRLTPADVASLIDLLHHLVLRTRGTPDPTSVLIVPPFKQADALWSFQFSGSRAKMRHVMVVVKVVVLEIWPAGSRRALCWWRLSPRCCQRRSLELWTMKLTTSCWVSFRDPTMPNVLLTGIIRVGCCLKYSLHDVSMNNALQVSLRQSRRWQSGWTALLFRVKDSWLWPGWHGAFCLPNMAQPLQGVSPAVTLHRGRTLSLENTSASNAVAILLWTPFI